MCSQEQTLFDPDNNYEYTWILMNQNIEYTIHMYEFSLFNTLPSIKTWISNSNTSKVYFICVNNQGEAVHKLENVFTTIVQFL